MLSTWLASNLAFAANILQINPNEINIADSVDGSEYAYAWVSACNVNIEFCNNIFYSFTIRLQTIYIFWTETKQHTHTEFLLIFLLFPNEIYICLGVVADHSDSPYQIVSHNLIGQSKYNEENNVFFWIIFTPVHVVCFKMLMARPINLRNSSSDKWKISTNAKFFLC